MIQSRFNDSESIHDESDRSMIPSRFNDSESIQ